MSQDNTSHRSPLQIALALALMAAVIFIVFYPAQAQLPSNDNWEEATEITSLPYSIDQDTTQATISFDDPLPSCMNSTPHNSVWFKYTPVSTTIIRVDASSTATTYYAFLAIYTHSEAGFFEVNCSGHTAASLTAQAGETYYFQINAMWYAEYPPSVYGGNLHLVVEELSAPANDNFADAQLITDMPFSDTVDISLATAEENEPQGECVYDWSYQTIWYRFDPPENGRLTVQSYGNNFQSFSSIFTFDEYGKLYWVGCEWGYGWGASVNLRAGKTYYIQAGSVYSNVQGTLSLQVSWQPAPPNDDFGNALLISALPFVYPSSNLPATSEQGEPRPSCAYNDPINTVWFAYTPGENRSVWARVSNVYFSLYLAIYTGDGFGNLLEERCSEYPQNNPLAFYAEAGETYYFQIGSQYYGEGGDYTFELDYTPSPTASFWFWPSDTSIYDPVTFIDSSYDPIDGGFSEFWWDFGDGATATGNQVTHQYAADGDYTVWHKVQTPDMRNAETTQVIQIRTHDVGIAKFNVPKSANAGQTRTIVVGLSNTRYPEVVVVELYKSVPGGYAFVGRLQQTVPVRPANRTTEFSFNYTFTAEDAALGKVTFKAIAYLQNYRDALPGDNEVNAPPTKVAR